MGKFLRVSLYILFTVGYAVFLSLGIVCLLNLLGMVMGLSLDGVFGLNRYPRFLPFCLFVGVFALAAIILLAILSYRFSEPLRLNKVIVVLQVIGGVLISFPIIKIWENIFSFLQRTF